MARPTKVDINVVEKAINQYFDEYGEECTAYQLSKFIDSIFMKVSWASVRIKLEQLENMGLVKKRVMKERTMFLPIDKEIVF